MTCLDNLKNNYVHSCCPCITIELLHSSSPRIHSCLYKYVSAVLLAYRTPCVFCHSRGELHAFYAPVKHYVYYALINVAVQRLRPKKIGYIY